MTTKIKFQPGRIKLSRVALAASILVLVILAWWWIRRPSSEEEPAAAMIASVKTEKVKQQPITARSASLGIICPLRQATVSAKISAPIARMDLLKNRAVKAGDVLVVLEAEDLRAQRAEARAALEELRITERNLTSGTIPQNVAQNEKSLRDARAAVDTARLLYERRRALFEQGAIARRELETAELALHTAENDLQLAERTSSLRADTLDPNEKALAGSRVKQAEERLAALETQLGYATIRAPFSGVVTEQFQFQGEFATAGGRLFAISDQSKMIVKAAFADTVAIALKVGNPASVSPEDIPGQSFTGSVALVSQAADPVNRTIEVWIELPNPQLQLHANTAAHVLVTTRTVAAAMTIPTTAVMFDRPDGDTGMVMVVDAQSFARERRVKTGIRDEDRVQIVEGLQPGESVVTDGNYALPDGTQVQVKQENPGAAEKERVE